MSPELHHFLGTHAEPPYDKELLISTFYAKNLLSQGKKEIRVLLVGRVGYGKSALINTIFDDNVVKEDDSAHSVTHTVSCHTITKYDVKVTIADTPGFFDDNEENTVPQILEEIRNKIPEVDLILFCIKMTERFSSTEKSLIRIITRAYGDGVWENVIFALTFANKVEVPRFQTIDLSTHFDNKLTDLRITIQNAVGTYARIKEEDCLNIPVLPVGSSDHQLPNTPDWFTPFWFNCFRQTHDRAKPAFLQIGIQLSVQLFHPDNLSFFSCSLNTLSADISESEVGVVEQYDETRPHWLRRIINFIIALFHKRDYGQIK